MKVLLVGPQVPDNFWSFKHVLRFIARVAAFPPLGQFPHAVELLIMGYHFRRVANFL